MTRYKITVTRSTADDHDWDDQPQAALVVDTSGGALRIADMTLRPGISGQLTVDDVPMVDMNLLARAFLTDLRPTPDAPGPTPTPANTKPDLAEDGPDKTKGRPYRRMPEPAQVLKVLREEGTVTAMARRFGVPRHTAQGWLQRIRRD